MPPLLIAAVPPPPDAGGGDALARHLLGITGWPIPKWMHPGRVSPSDVLSVYVDLVYLWPEYQHRRPAREAHERAEALPRAGRLVVLLGRESARAFRWQMMDFFEWWEMPESLVALLPYPSPWNRLWNYRENRRLGRQMLNRALEMEQEVAHG